VQTKQAVVELQ
jgi:hypothetical protein